MRQKLRQLRLMRSKALIEVEIKYFIDRAYVAAGTLIFQINVFLYRKVKTRYLEHVIKKGHGLEVFP